MSDAEKTKEEEVTLVPEEEGKEETKLGEEAELPPEEDMGRFIVISPPAPAPAAGKRGIAVISVNLPKAPECCPNPV